MAEPTKEKLLEVEEVRARIDALKQSVAEMAEYVGIEDRRKRLAELEEQQASADFWNNQAKAKEVIAHTPEFLCEFEIKTFSGFSMYLPCNGTSELDKYYRTLEWNKATGLVE